MLILSSLNSKRHLAQQSSTIKNWIPYSTGLRFVQIVCFLAGDAEAYWCWATNQAFDYFSIGWDQYNCASRLHINLFTFRVHLSTPGLLVVATTTTTTTTMTMMMMMMMMNSFIVQSQTICNSRKCTYLPHRRAPHPSGNSNKAAHISLYFWVLQNSPHPKKLQSLLWGEYGYFLEVHNSHGNPQ